MAALWIYFLLARNEVSTGSSSDRVSPSRSRIVAIIETRSLPLPVRTAQTASPFLGSDHS